MNILNVNSAGGNQVWSAASAPMSPDQKMSNLFDAIDTSSNGSISKSQFEQAFQTMNPPAGYQAAGVDAVWNKLDPNGTGSVSKQDFVSTMTSLMKQMRGHHHHHHSSSAGATTAAQSTTLLNSLGQSNPETSSTSITGVNLDQQA